MMATRLGTKMDLRRATIGALTLLQQGRGTMLAGSLRLLSTMMNKQGARTQEEMEAPRGITRGRTAILRYLLLEVGEGIGTSFTWL